MTLLITQALDERDLLVSKIKNKIGQTSFADVKKENEDRVVTAMIDEKTFSEGVKSSFQSIEDLIKRFVAIDGAISESNAKTVIKTSRGDMTIAAAISFRGRMKGMGSYDNANFERQLIEKMKSDLNGAVYAANAMNSKVQAKAEEMRITILGKDAKGKEGSAEQLEVVDAYVKKNTASVIDPLGAKDKVAEMSDSLEAFIKELDTLIKVSNATTSIEID